MAIIFQSLQIAEGTVKSIRKATVGIEAIREGIRMSDLELTARLRQTEQEEKNSWKIMCPHGIH